MTESTPPLRTSMIVNAHARGVAKRFDSEKVRAYLKKKGVEVDYSEPPTVEAAVETAATSAARGDDLCFVVGGDGSLRVVAAGLVGTATPMAPLPGGTVNNFAREIGIPSSIKAAIDAHLTGQRLPMDIGKASNGEYFIMMASVGWDASIASTISPGLKKRIGDKAYIVEGFKRAPRLRTKETTWEMDGSRFEESLALLVVSNTRLYGGRVEFTPDSLANDGSFDMVALCPHGVKDAARLGWKSMRGKLGGEDDRTITGRVKGVSVETPGLDVQLDGDVVGQTPMSFEIVSGGLMMSVPSGPLTKIFQPLEPRDAR